MDVYTVNMEVRGVKTRQDVYRDGNWHRTFHGWIVAPWGGGHVIFQHRSEAKRDFPSMFDVSSAGHYLAGESGTDGVREIKEELGIQIPREVLQYLGVRTDVRQSGERIDCEFAEVYLARDPRPVEQYHPDVEEVRGLLAMPLEAGLALFSGHKDSAQAPYLDAVSGQMTSRVVTRAEFVPSKDQYALVMLIMAQRFLEGKPVAI